MKLLSIGQLARLAGISVETIRYYEREGLIPEPRRSAAGYRQYRPDAARRIRFIQRAKGLGFSLKEILDLLCLRAVPGASCADVRRQAQAKIRDIEQKLEQLASMKQALGQLVAACDMDAPASDCPILETLEDDETGTASPGGADV